MRRLPARVADDVPLPDWLAPPLAGALLAAGVDRLWAHQAQTAQAARAGEHVVVATGTASGKTLAFQLPILTAVVDGQAAATGRGATALYLAPTKALAHDQLARLDALAVPGLRAGVVDGDTPPEQRRWAREHAAYVLTNPDLLHHSLLPGHEHWASFLRALRYVVVDECHVYRGVFGAHVALVLRRLRRVAARYRSAPTFVLASATVAQPAEHAGRLIGMPVRPVTDDGSPRAPVTIGLWEPSAATTTETGRLLAELVGSGARTVAFTRTRAGAEWTAAVAARALGGDRVAAYRGGYLPEERRELEAQLRDGRLAGLAATTALELGVDVSGLDAVLLAGWPGSHASFWQQVGRAGRSGRESLAVLVAADDPLDHYLVAHPEAVLDSPVEAAVLDPGNPHVLAGHVACAAAELPVTEADAAVLGPGTPAAAEALVADGTLRRRPTGFYWARPDRPGDLVGLRGVGRQVRIVERRTGRVLGHVDAARAEQVVHRGAVYVHQGQAHVVVELDPDDACALVIAGDPGWTTQARTVTGVQLGAARARLLRGATEVGLGQVVVRSRVVSFLRRDHEGTVLGEHPLDLPERCLETVGTWWAVDPQVAADDLAAAGRSPGELAGAVHAVEHAALGLLPLVARAERFDVGAASSVAHPDTGRPTVVVHDGQRGGAGFAERGYAGVRTWVAATHAVVAGCRCRDGCPSCVQSPRCGTGNSPLAKDAAAALLGRVVADLAEAEPEPTGAGRG